MFMEFVGLSPISGDVFLMLYLQWCQNCWLTGPCDGGDHTETLVLPGRALADNHPVF